MAAPPGPFFPAAAYRPSKRIIVCCDGTWLDSDSGLKGNKISIPSNVTRISLAIKPESSDKIPQVVYYQAGVGSMGSIFDKIVGGATAVGISDNIRAAYSFIAKNYHTGDEIFLTGFSRGAFTARSVAGLIDYIGLLTRDGIPYLAEIFEDYENRENPNYKSAYPNIPFPEKPSAGNPTYVVQLGERRLSRLNIPVKAIGVWDTVGSLGVPRVPWLERLGLQTKSVKEYSFFDTSLGNCIENAFQALGLDEHRASFSPTLWEKTRGNRTNLRQVWFPGVHSNVGGGYDDQEIANMTLAWMIAQLERFIDFDPNYIREQFEQNRQYYIRTDQRVRPWSFGELYNSFTGVYILGGSARRTPGAYYRVNPSSGRPTSKPLRDTNEYIHPSVRSRICLDGPGVKDRGYYEPKAMDDYKLRFQELEPGVEPKRSFAVWESRTKRRGQPRKVLRESPILGTERLLLEYSPKMYGYVMDEQLRTNR